MNSIAKTVGLRQQRGQFLEKPRGFARKLLSITTQALFILISVVACTDAREFKNVINPREIVPSQINLKPAAPVTFQSVGKGYRSGVRAPLQIVARNQDEWTALWRQHVSSDSGSRPPPAVDFDKEVVVALFLGDKPTGGYDVQISRAEQSSEALTIYYREKNPSPGSMVTQALTQPFHIVRIIGDVSSDVIFRRE